MAKTPQDRKKKAHAKTELFEFSTDEGTLRFPYIENIPMGIFEDVMEQENEAAGVRMLLEGIMDEETQALRRKMTFGEFQDMLDKWNEQSAITLGES